MQLSRVEGGVLGDRARGASSPCVLTLRSVIKDTNQRGWGFGGAPEANLTPFHPLSPQNLPLSLPSTSLFVSNWESLLFHGPAYRLFSSLFAPRIILISSLSFRHPQTRFFISSPSLPPSLPVSCCISPTPPNSAKCSRHKSTSMW